MKHKIKHRGFFGWLDANLPIVLPEVRHKKFWDITILLFVVYNSVSVPLEATFVLTKPKGLLRAEVVIDIMFGCDLFYTFRTAYVDGQGQMVRDGGRIARHYIKSWFPIDAMASMPFEYLIVLWNIISGSSKSVDLTLLSFLKVQLPPSECSGP